MKSKFASFVMTIIMILIITILGIFGIMIYQEITGKDAGVKVQNFVATYQTIIDDIQDEEKVTTPQIIDSNVNEMSNTPTANTNLNYNTVKINKYFYDQLDEYSKIIYRALEANKEQMKTGTAQIELGTSFSELLEKENGEKLLGQYYQSAVESYLYDNPDVFYITANKLYLNIETITKRNKKTYNVYINNGTQLNYFTEEYTSESQVRQAIQQVEQVKNQIVANKTGDTYTDIKMVHDYIINNTEYDTTISQPNIYNIYGALVSKRSVCEGYAEAFKYLLDALEIPCVIVIGEATNSSGEKENHAWNYVKIDDGWYAVDTTWDDPVIIGNGRISNESKYKYFLRGSSRMSQEHIPSGQFTEGGKIYTYPSLRVYDYN